MRNNFSKDIVEVCNAKFFSALTYLQFEAKTNRIKSNIKCIQCNKNATLDLVLGSDFQGSLKAPS